MNWVVWRGSLPCVGGDGKSPGSSHPGEGVVALEERAQRPDGAAFQPQVFCLQLCDLGCVPKDRRALVSSSVRWEQ